jgi:hypothetical protein
MINVLMVEDLPRYTHNYWGLRNRFGFLSETYSYFLDAALKDATAYPIVRTRN